MNILKLRRNFRKQTKKLTRAIKNKDHEYFSDDYVFWLEEQVVKNICDSQCCVNHQGKEKTDIDITQTRKETFNFEVSQLADKKRYCDDCGDYVGKGCDNIECKDFKS